MVKSKIVKLGSKIIRGEIPELVFRGREAIGKLSERKKAASGYYKFSRDRLSKLLVNPDLLSQGLAEHFKNRKSPRFFSLKNRRTDLALISKRYPEQVEHTIKIAEQILRDNFPIFGNKSLDYGSPPDWFYDPIADVRSKPDFYADIEYLDYSKAGDSKIVWELSRLKFIYPLGQAYLLTGHDNYALKAFGLLEDWFKRNPVKYGINWASSLECTYRIYALIWMLEFFREIELIDDRMAEMIWFYIYQMADHIVNHLSYYFSPNTHLTGEAFGLFITGLLFPEFKRARDFQNLGLHILEQELSNQFTEEGIHAELSSYYHRSSADYYQQTLILCDLNNIAPHPIFQEMTLKMADYLKNLRRPDGLWPQVGDSDGGKLTWLQFEDVRDYSAMLSTASRFFNKSELWPFPEQYETAWLMSPEKDYDKKKSASERIKSIEYDKAGYAILRSEDSAKYLLFHYGSFGYKDCVHSHADNLSFELVVGDVPVIIDPGTYCYSKNYEMRNYFRGARAHNICLVDDCGVNDPEDIFCWQQQVNSKKICSILHTKFDFVKARASRLSRPSFTHTRNIIRISSDYFMIIDELEKDAKDQAEFLYHTPFSSHSFSPKANHVTLTCSTVDIMLKPLIQSDYDFKVKSGQKDKPWGWYSPDYDQLEKISTMIFAPDAEEKSIFPLCVYPSGKTESKPVIEQMENHSWKIKTDQFTDIWRFDITGAITCVRKIDNKLHSFFLSGTGRLHLKGGKVWESEKTTGLYGWIEDETVCLLGDIAGKCKFWNPEIKNAFYGDRVIQTVIDNSKIEFEI